MVVGQGIIDLDARYRTVLAIFVCPSRSCLIEFGRFAADRRAQRGGAGRFRDLGRVPAALVAEPVAGAAAFSQ
jgi:hypothetical protein